MEQTFYSNGKLLITGEYLVLDGARAFALPTRFGQWLSVWPGTGKKIRWTSFDADGSIWFETEIGLDEIRHKIAAADPVRHTLINILHAAAQMNPAFYDTGGFDVQTRLTFARQWGLGTSSTLISNIGQWLGIDAYQLLWNSFGGSGYDIACAQHNSAIVYQRLEGGPMVEPIDFAPDFTTQLYFVYLNRKQNSQSAIANYKNKRFDLKHAVQTAGAIAENIVKSGDAVEFAQHLRQYENLLSPILGMPAIQQQLFADFDGTVKSLGAWGGDFVLAVCKTDPTAYFHARGFETVLTYREMILSNVV